MVRPARRYEIYLPLTFNDGQAIPRALFDGVEDRLLDWLGGLTSQRSDFAMRGIWQGATKVYYDDVIVITCLDFRRRGSARFIGKLKQSLLRDFEQEDILITESTLRVY